MHFHADAYMHRIAKDYKTTLFGQPFQGTRKTCIILSYLNKIYGVAG